VTTGPGNRRGSQHKNEKIARAIEALSDLLPEDAKHRDLIVQMLDSTMSLPDTKLDRSEIKILRSSLLDFVNAFDTFAGYREKKKVSIFGSARTPQGSPLYNHCRDFSAALVEAGFMAITGAGPGIMQAGNEGATREKSFGVNIDLPFEQSSNPFIDGDPKCINFKYFFARKLTFVKESQAVVLFPGGMGTMDEGFETLTLIQTGKCNPIPMILLDIPGSSYWIEWEMFVRDVLAKNGLISSDDFNLFRYTTDIDKAIHEIKFFYKNYHSLRYIGSEVILRIKKKPTPALLEELNKRYRILLASGDFEIMDNAHPAELDDTGEVLDCHRIRFHSTQRRFGTLRRMIDTINLTEL
jgi:uncharacterized protein (TIGR00730 family)